MNKLYLFIFIFAMVGCKSSSPTTIDEMVPALDEENNLLFESVPLNVARKNVVHPDDWPIDECQIQM
tara:strand:+ start:420 stop:620 length:201 start_codon:yes stop_codon:yes gene_type:complete